MNNNLELPKEIAAVLSDAVLIYLSVSPVSEYRTVLENTKAQLLSEKKSTQVLALKEFQNIKTSKESLIIACGDVSLTQLPSFLGGFVGKKKHAMNGLLSKAFPWMALRCCINESGEHHYKYLSSSVLEKADISLLDPSWTDNVIRQARFGKSKNVVVPINSPSTPKVEDDLEFID